MKEALRQQKEATEMQREVSNICNSIIILLYIHYCLRCDKNMVFTPSNSWMQPKSRSLSKNPN